MLRSGSARVVLAGLLVSLLIVPAAYAAPGNEAWSVFFGAPEAWDEALAGAADPAGGSYVVGYTEGDLDGESAGEWDGFVRRYDASGTLLWGVQFGTESEDSVDAAAVWPSGGVVVGGFTGGELDGELAGVYDAFVRRYDADGSMVWADQFGTAGFDGVAAVAVGEDGSVVVGGYTTGHLGGESAGDFDAFVRRYEPDGSVAWTVQFGTAAQDVVTGVALGDDGAIYAVGRTGGALWGPSSGDFDAFSVRLDGTTGDPTWTDQFGTSGYDSAEGVALAPDGSVLVAGVVSGDFAATSQGGLDGFLRRTLPDGTVAWTTQYGTAGDDYFSGVAVDPAGVAYVAGRTASPIDGDFFGIYAFAMAFDASGAARWHTELGVTTSDGLRSAYAHGVSANGSGLYVVGSDELAHDAFVMRLEPGVTDDDPPPPVQLSSKEECMKGGWMRSELPVFKNQGECVAFFASGGKNKR